MYFHNVIHYVFSSHLFSITYAIHILIFLLAYSLAERQSAPSFEFDRLGFGARDSGLGLTERGARAEAR